MDGVIKAEAGEFAGMQVKPQDDHTKTDIEIIKKLGQQRMFAQRARLYPNLSKHYDWNEVGAVVFNQYLVDATRMLNLLIRMGMKADDLDWKARTFEAMQVLAEKYPFVPVKPTVLILFEDIAPISPERIYTRNAQTVKLKAVELFAILWDLVQLNLLESLDAENTLQRILGEENIKASANIWLDIVEMCNNIKSI